MFLKNVYSAPVIFILIFITLCSSETTSNLCKIEDTTAICENINNFTTFEDPRITKLIVTDKDLRIINKTDFSALENLETIDLSNLGLEEIDPHAFEYLQLLKNLNLAGNTDLKIPDDGPFIISKYLTYLNISNTSINELREDIFVDIPNLEVLDLSLTTIKNFTAIGHLKQLTTIVVSKTTELDNTICSIEHIIRRSENGEEESIECNIKNVTTTEENNVQVETTTITEISQTIEQNTTENIVETTEHQNENTETTTTTEKPAEITEKVEITNETNTENVTDEITTETKESVTEQQTIKQETIEDSSKTTVSTNEDQPKTETQTQINDLTTETDENIIGNKENINKGETREELNNSFERSGIDANVKVNEVVSANTSHSYGVNIVLGIILCAGAVAGIAFGYKYIKNRRRGYSHANTTETEEDGKELQTIVAHHTDSEQN